MLLYSIVKKLFYTHLYKTRYNLNFEITHYCCDNWEYTQQKHVARENIDWGLIWDEHVGDIFVSISLIIISCSSC